MVLDECSYFLQIKLREAPWYVGLGLLIMAILKCLTPDVRNHATVADQERNASHGPKTGPRHLTRKPMALCDMRWLGLRGLRDCLSGSHSEGSMHSLGSFASVLRPLRARCVEAFAEGVQELDASSRLFGTQTPRTGTP